MNKPVIITDVDNVLLDWLEGFTRFLEKEKNIDVSHIKQHLGTTAFIDSQDITKIACLETNKLLIREYGKSNYLEELNAFQEDAAIHINELHKEFDFIALTCLSKNKKTINKRKRNLQNVYGNVFKDVICIGFGQSKEPDLFKLKQTENVVTFIDDREQHIKESISAGIKPILFSRGVENPLHCVNDTFQTKKCWTEIKEHLLLELDLNKIIINKKSKNRNIKNTI
jgi:FMN phosphatase YigB (HAD superfamily)